MYIGIVKSIDDSRVEEGFTQMSGGGVVQYKSDRNRCPKY